MSSSGSRKHTQLVVVTQPPAEFYKDEGGKSNFMTMIVTTPSSFPLTFTIRLKASLYFESEKPVEDKEQSILSFVHNNESLHEISPENPNAIFEFRLEKVSRRKDGQRFKVYIEPTYEGETPRERPLLHGVFSNPICVMSKRKTGERVVASQIRQEAARHFPLGAPVGGAAMHGIDVIRTLKALSAQVTSLNRNVQELTDKLAKQTDRVTHLESYMRHATGSFVSGLPTEYDGGGAGAGAVAGAVAGAAPMGGGSGGAADAMAAVGAAAAGEGAPVVMAASVARVPMFGAAASFGAGVPATTTAPPPMPPQPIRARSGLAAVPVLGSQSFLFSPQAQAVPDGDADGRELKRPRYMSSLEFGFSGEIDGGFTPSLMLPLKSADVSGLLALSTSATNAPV